MPSPSPPLNREQRTRCYGARDEYLQCVQDHCEQAIGKDEDNHTVFRSPEPCEQLLQAMGLACPQSWVLHFQLQWGNERVLEGLKRGVRNK